MGNCLSARRKSVTTGNHDSQPNQPTDIVPITPVNDGPEPSHSAATHAATQHSSRTFADTASKSAFDTVTGVASRTKDAKYTVFISHAGEDKATIAIPLREKLAAHGITAFVDEADMQPGTEAEKAMTSAMESAKVAVVVLSPEFTVRKWPLKELMCFLDRHEKTAEETGSRPVIIPFFYRLSIRELYDEPRLDRVDKDGILLHVKSRFDERMKNGEPEANPEGVKAALLKLRGIIGVRNYVDATNDSTLYDMIRKREILLDELCNKVIEAVPKEIGATEIGSTFQETRTSLHRVDRFHKSFPPSSFGVQAVLNFIVRDERGDPSTPESWVKRYLLEQTNNAPHVVAIHGIGGVGKSTILQALAVDDDIRRKFSDGVHVMRLGKDATKAKVFEVICGVLRASGAEKTEQWLRVQNDVDEALDKFEEWFDGRKCLFLIDDAWAHGIGIGIFSRLCKIGNTRSRNSVLLTTREHEISSIAPRERIVYMKPREVRGSGSREILFFHAGHQESEVTNKSDQDAIERILDVCGGLPVGLSAAGKNVKKMKIDMGGEKEGVWSEYMSQLSVCRTVLWLTNVESYRNLFATFETSLAFLDAKTAKDVLGFKTRLSFREMHLRLCVIQKQDVVPSTMLMHLWETRNEGYAGRIATAFIERGLASRETVYVGSKRAFGLSLHDSVHDFAVMKADDEDKTKEAHQRLLNGYSWCGVEVCCEEGESKKWWSSEVIEDGYIHRNLCRHLFGAEEGTELIRLLMSPGWTARQLEINGILVLEADFLFGIETAQEEQNDEDADRHDEVQRALELISEAVRLSWTFVAKNKRELWFQVHGRLMRVANEVSDVREYLNWIKKEAEMPQVRLESCLLVEAGGVNTKIISVGVAVNCMVMIEDRERVACGCGDGSVVIVNLKGGKIEKSWKVHDDVTSAFVLDIAIGRNGTRLVSLAYDGSVKVWDVESNRCVAMFKGHTASVNRVAVMKDGKRIVTVSSDGTAQVWDMDTGLTVSEPFTGHEGPVRCVAVLGDGEHVVTGGHDKKLRMWNTSSGAEVGEPLVGHDLMVLCVAVTPDSKRIVSGSLDETVKIWDLRRREQIGEPLSGHTSGAESVAVSRDGTRIVSSSYDKTIRLWDVESGEEICDTLEGHTSWVTGVLFLTGRDSIVSCSEDGSVRLWDVGRKNTGRVMDRHEDGVSSVAFTPDGKLVVSSSWDCTLRMWDVKSGEQIGDPLRGHSDMVTGVALMPNGHHVVSVSYDQTMRVWDLQSRELLHTLTGHTPPIWCVAMTRNGEYAVTGSADKRVRVWDMRAMDGSHVVLEGHSASVIRVFVSDNDKRIISVNVKDDVFVWELETGQLVKEVSKENAARLSRKQVMDLVEEMTVYDDAGLSILRYEREIRYGDGEKMEVLGTLEADVTSWALSPDGKTICVGLRDGKVGFMKLER